MEGITMPSRVLVVEDNEMIRKAMLKILGKYKLNIYSIESGEEAIELAQFFDLILMDVKLPGISGVEATRRIRQREKQKGLSRVPIVATTGGGNRGECLAAGMDDFMQKPINPEDIEMLLERWIFSQPQTKRLLG